MENSRFEWYEDDNYRFVYDEMGGEIYVHVHLYKFSKSILTDLKSKWAHFLLRLYSLGYDNVYTFTKDTRIVDIIGGGTIVGEVEGHKVIQWELS